MRVAVLRPASPEPRVRRSRNGRAIPRPFLKWVGGKAQLAAAILARCPDRVERYFEPFLGGGAIFFETQPEQALLSDCNPELINAWTVVRDQLEALLAALREHAHDEAWYYEVRARKPRDLSPVDAAARTIFLNKTGFNGLYRLNSKGGFNVPFGRYDNPQICDEPNLRAVSERLASAELRVQDFEATLAEVGPGDVAYVDPPYVPATPTASFTSYTAAGFGDDDHRRLCHALLEVDRRGGRFILSNSDTPRTRALYAPLLDARGMVTGTVGARRSINRDPNRRGPAPELLVSNTGA